MKIDRAGIEKLVPHAGAMCLLDGVTDWGPESIACTSAAPGPRHPLARAERVPAIAAAEYAAQATAVHGALLESAGRPRSGLLATLMDVRLAAAVIAADGGDLAIKADLLSRSAGGCLYSFEVSNANTPIASGRLLVALLAEEPA
jgi:predicted hotdog family 3-hydroxylacyl-ACP dehydratase